MKKIDPDHLAGSFALESHIEEMRASKNKSAMRLVIALLLFDLILIPLLEMLK